MTGSASSSSKASWFLAFAAAAALHGGTVYWLLAEREPPGAAGAGQGGIEVSMASGAAVGDQAITPPDEREVLPETMETAELEEVVPEPVEPEATQPEATPEPTPPPEATEMPPIEAAPTDAVAAPPEPAVQEQASTESAESVPEEVRPAPVEPTEVAPPQPVEEQQAEPSEPMVAEDVSPPAPPAPAIPSAKPEPPPRPQPVRQAEALPEPSRPDGNRGAGGSQWDPNAGEATQSSRSAGGAAGVSPTYQTEIMAWLERYKRYPERAQRRRIEGTALLRFTLAPDGEVLAYALERSTGSEELDREVIRMIERASPLPAMPADLVVSRLELSVPVTFALR